MNEGNGKTDQEKSERTKKKKSTFQNRIVLKEISGREARSGVIKENEDQ